MLGSFILYLKGMRIMMFQLSGFYYSYMIQTLATGSWNLLWPAYAETVTGCSCTLIIPTTTLVFSFMCSCFEYTQAHAETARE